MIKKLRFKFIVLTMLSLLLVLTLIIGSINLLNYRDIVSDADSLLAILNDNNGSFPKQDSKQDSKPDSKPDSTQDSFKAERDKAADIPMSPETPYESRYFSVLMSESGNTITVDTGKIAAIDTTMAIAYARTVLNHSKDRGFAGNYRYMKQLSGTSVRITFLDCGKSLSTFRTFLATSLSISFLGLLAVLFLIILLSGRIIKPVSDSYEKQKRFITDAGHELKTPLTIIDADADVLLMDIGENEWIEDIQKQVGRLAALTNNLICLSRMDEGQNQFQMIDFPISDVIAESAQSFQSLAMTGNKNFYLNIQPMLSFYGDEKALRQLISLLLDNALKYSDEGGTITLSLEKQRRTLRLCVFNTTASPVSDEDLKHMFDRFYRADSSRNSKNGGYGIGLSIATAIVAAHKGKITASSQDGHSLLITILLPA